MVYSGVVKDGVVVFSDDASLPEGTLVRVEAMPNTDKDSDGDDALYRLGDFAGPTGVPDLSVNIDHYLYGHPKVDDAN